MTDRDEVEAAESPAAAEDAPTGDAADEGGTTGEHEEEGLAEVLDPLQEELEALNDRHLRLAAEFQNYRRRAENEMAQARGRAQTDLLRSFLEVLDDLQRVSGLDPAEESVSVESIVEGVDLVERKFLRTLEEAGVEVIDPAGEPFDPETMEAVMRVAAEDPEDEDHVEQVFQKGYRLKGHLVRPARVSVLKHG